MHSSGPSVLLCFCVSVGCLLISIAADCPMGYYGANCRTLCSEHCVSMDCHNSTGTCVGGCDDGWVGDMCDTPCEPGHYGANCSLACPLQCEDNTCAADTGDCLDCKPGSQGLRCDQKCDPGFFGPGCAESCPSNCATPDCHPQSGYCLKGCKQDFWGSDCSLAGDIRELPGEQEKFYQQLSAESKSVLLYVLMGEYGRTLERAQMEIRRGIRQRNEISQLLGGSG